jgi:large subunit ribosomal protein L15e
VYKYSTDILKKTGSPDLTELARQRKIAWRRQKAIVRVGKPLRLRRARSLGYKAKQGFITVRVRVRRGGLRKQRPARGRRQRHMGVTRFVPSKSMQLIAEERAGKTFHNLEVLNSYWVGEDGQYKWFEILLVDPHHPSIRGDEDINWICDPSQRGRVHRGLTSSGKQVRGLRH